MPEGLCNFITQSQLANTPTQQRKLGLKLSQRLAKGAPLFEAWTIWSNVLYSLSYTVSPSTQKDGGS